MASIAQPRGLQALVTRPRDEAAALATALAARGVGAVLEPLLEVRFLAADISDLGGVQALLCTSGNGVRAFARLSEERRLPLFAVGDGTAARARAKGFTAVASAGGDAADLARLVGARLRPQDGRLLHICGRSVAGDFADDLRAQGFTVDRRVLYEARARAALSCATVRALGSRAVACALFFSPRTAAIFVRLATDAGVVESCRAIAALSISGAVDAALAVLPWRRRLIAEDPTQAALLAALDRLLVEQPQG